MRMGYLVLGLREDGVVILGSRIRSGSERHSESASDWWWIGH